MPIKTLQDFNLKDKRVIYRVDLNVPMYKGKVSDQTRIIRLLPTFKELLKQKAKIIVISHFGRPKGQYDFDMSLAPVTNALSEALGGIDIKFAVDCIGSAAKEATNSLNPGEILLLENLRFHGGEESNDKNFIKKLAELGDFYVNDAFSCCHRNHASIVGIPKILPSCAGLLLHKEITSLHKILDKPKTPFAAIVGGSKISTKLSLLATLIKRTQYLIIGGAMANTFLKAQGVEIGTSLCENNLVNEAKNILQQAQNFNCKIILPQDVITAANLHEHAECSVSDIDKTDKNHMILDIGPKTVNHIATILASCQTLAWNGPLGAFENRPFDVGTISLARSIAYLSKTGKLTAIAGGGDVVAALSIAGLNDSFSYISTAGGAFLQWLENKTLPGVSVLE